MEKINYDITLLDETPKKEEHANLESEKTSVKLESKEPSTTRNQSSDQRLFPMVDRSTKPKLSSPQPRLSSPGKPAPTDGEILSVHNTLDTSEPKLEKVNNSEVPSGGQNPLSSPLSKTMQRLDLSSKQSVTATGDATIAAQEAELKDFEVQNEMVIQEHEVRLAQVKAEEEKISRLQKVKQDEAKATANLMRKKRAIEDDIRQLKEEEARR